MLYNEHMAEWFLSKRNSLPSRHARYESDKSELGQTGAGWKAGDPAL